MPAPSPTPPSRRQFLVAAGAVLAAPLLPASTVNLLDELEASAVRFFFEHSDPQTGLVRDRARASGPEARNVASIAATGFGLSAMCIADRRGWLPPGEARRRVMRTLEYLANRADHRHGFYWHFMDMSTGVRSWHSEISSVDTSWLLCGTLHAREHFALPSIDRLAAEIQDRVDWRWMLDGANLLSHGWTPEAGFLPYRWDSYAEFLAMYLLALGSSTAPLPPSTWDAWKRPVRRCGGIRYIDSSTPLFTHQYSHAWFDFRQRRDRYADYFENSRRATLANRMACIEQAHQFRCYDDNVWGITTADTSGGYRNVVSPDGTLVPCAAGGSIAFLPRECGAVLETMLARYGSRIWCRYGFIDAFEPEQNWYGPDVIGIDLGIMLLMAENARTGSVWETMAAAPEVQRGLVEAGFRTV